MNTNISLEQIRDESSKMQIEFIMSMIKLCEQYSIQKTEFIRSTINELYKFSQTTNFDKLNYK